MSFTVFLSRNATVDIVNARQYYDSKSDVAGEKFVEEIALTIERISNTPKAFSIRHRNIRAAKLRSYPYLLFYRVDEPNSSIQLLRVFNTYLRPLW